MFTDPGGISVEQDLPGGRSGEGKATPGRLSNHILAVFSLFYCKLCISYLCNARVTGDSDTGEEVENEGETEDEGEETTIRRFLPVIQGVFFNWCPPKSCKCFSVSKMF